MKTFKGHSGEITSGTFSLDGTQIVTTAADKTIRIWNAESGRNILTFSFQSRLADETPAAALFFPDGERIASIGSNGTVVIWSLNSGKALATFGTTLTWLGDAILSPDGSRLLISNFQYGAYLWNTANGKLVGSEPSSSTPLTSRTRGAAFSSDGSRLVLGSAEGTVTVWDTKEGTKIKDLLHDESVWTVLFAPDSNWLVTADTKINVWNTPESGGGAHEKLFDLPGDREGLSLSGFSNDGQLLLTIGGNSKSIRIWRIGTGAEWKKLTRSSVSQIRYSSDGGRLATLGRDIKIWHTKTWQKTISRRKPMPGHTAQFLATWSALRLPAHGRQFAHTICWIRHINFDSIADVTGYLRWHRMARAPHSSWVGAALSCMTSKAIANWRLFPGRAMISVSLPFHQTAASLPPPVTKQHMCGTLMREVWHSC